MTRSTPKSTSTSPFVTQRSVPTFRCTVSQSCIPIQLKDAKVALEHLNTALSLDPEYVKAGMKRVQIYMELEMFEEAVREAENIFKKEKSQSKSHRMSFYLLLM